MTAAEKKDLYTLFRVTDNWLCGYNAPDFLNQDNKDLQSFFKDDKEIELKPQQTQDTPLIQSKTSCATLESIAQKIKVCHNCVLYQNRTQTVPGEGVEKPFVLVVGEAPGEDEDKTGKPFVGKAGQLLDKMLFAISLDRTCNCYIANIVKCRPPQNRTPFAEEATACSGYLQAQIHILKPKMILALGRSAAQSLLQTSQGINALRGKFFSYQDIPLLATYHPSALLRDEKLKRPAWEDLKIFRSKLEQEYPSYNLSFTEKYSKDKN